MAAVVSGSKTITRDFAPHLTGPMLTAILAKAPENLTIAEVQTLLDATSRVPAGTDPNRRIGEILD